MKDVNVTLYMAMSLDGKIARPDYDENFLSHENWLELLSLEKKSGILIWGRRTYEFVSGWGPKYLNSLNKVKIIVVSSKEIKVKSKNVFHAFTPKEAVEIAKKLGAKEAILSGGSTLNKFFLKDKLVNKIIINIEPVIVGAGIPLIADDFFDVKLRMNRVIKKKRGILQLSYDVV